MPKTFILDTNVLLHDPDAVFKFDDNNVVIPFVVIEEIDSQKKRQDEVGRNARTINKLFDNLRSLGNLAIGVPLPQKGTLRIELNHQHMPDGLLVQDAADNRILALTYNLAASDPQVILVTKDLNLRVKASAFGLEAQDYYNDKIDITSVYEEPREVYLTAEELNLFYKEGRLAKVSDIWHPHQFLILKCTDNPSQSALSRYYNGHLHKLYNSDTEVFGVKAKNKEQKFAIELLLNPQIKMVTLLGKAGSGKTLLALAAALELVYNQTGKYQRIIVARPTIPMGEDLGFLPGTKDEKLRPWMSPIYDNFEFLFSGVDEPSGNLVEELKIRGLLELDALTYIRGRSIPNQFFICDEAQNLTPKQVKTLVTRMGEGSKLVLTGDPEQIDNPYLDSSSNGLTYVTEKFKHEDLAGSVTLIKSERSELAELGARLL